MQKIKYGKWRNNKIDTLSHIKSNSVGCFSTL